MTFTAAHRGGAGEPLLLLHGFMDTWRTWELILPALERRHDVLAPALPGHPGGPPLPSPSAQAALDLVEAMLDDAGWETAHVAGNSLGGWLALGLAARGRARSVVTLAPAGGWVAGDEASQRLFDAQAELHEQVRETARFADAIAATPEGRRRATALVCERSDHLPADLVAHLIRGVAACDAGPLVEGARSDGWELDAAAVTCPVRVVWGAEDRLLSWPQAAERFRRDWLPQADWVVLDGVGHCPQLDVPLETAQLILGWTAP